MRYWRSTTDDRRFVGYRVRDYGAPRLSRLHRWWARQHAAEQVVAQSRLVWTFAHTGRRKAHDWKSTYHDVRALVRPAHAYGSERNALRSR